MPSIYCIENTPQKLGLHLKWTAEGRGAQIRAHSKELEPAGHFSLADAFWPKKKPDKIWIPAFWVASPFLAGPTLSQLISTTSFWSCRRSWLKRIRGVFYIWSHQVFCDFSQKVRSSQLFTVWCKFLQISIFRNLYATFETHRNALSQMSEQGNKPNCFGETVQGLNPAFF